MKGLDKQMINQQGHEAWRGIKQGFAEGVLKSVPIVIGYLPVAVAFGLISTQSGLSLYHTVLMSVMVYAGASQFMAVSMLAGGVGAMEIILATFILNFRHFIMSLSLMNGIKSVPNQWKWVLSSWITDETFSVASFHKEKAGPGFLAGLMLTAYGSWIFGTLLGALLGDFIPPVIGESMSIALYAMFIGLLVPSVRKNWRIGLISVLSMLLCYLFSQFTSSGWSIVLATVLGSLAGLVLKRRETDE